MAKYNDRGEEILDDTPLEAPIKFTRPRSIQELIALHVRSMMQVERAMGQEEDEDDFEEEEERDDILTPYELHAMAGDADMEFRRAKRTKEVIDKLQKKKENTGTVNGDRKESKDETGTERSADGGKRSDDDGEVGAASGGKGRSAGERSGGVS